MSDIKNNLNTIRAELPAHVRLVAVSKNHPVEDIRAAYDAGQRIFGENRVQEIVAKRPLLPPDIEWHMIGHLQSNKVKQIAPFVAMIQSVDSQKLLSEISEQAQKNNRVIACLLQVHIATEETKFGFDEQELTDLLLEIQQHPYGGIRIAGLMGMATFTEDTELIKREFSGLKSLFCQVQQRFFSQDPSFCELSMGMSGDYPIAIGAGSTLVRIGTKIFGARNYHT